MPSILLWKAIQTREFAGIVSSRIKGTLYRKFGLEINFERFDLSIIPPQTALKNIVVKKYEGKKFFMEAEDLELRFNFFDLISREISVGKISVKNSSIHFLEKVKESKDGMNKIHTQLDLAKRNLHRMLPFNFKMLVFEKVDLVTNYGRYFIHKMDIESDKNAIAMSGEIEHINGIKKINRLLPDADIISFDFRILKNLLTIKALSLEEKLNKVDIRGEVKLHEEMFSDLNINFKGEAGFIGRISNNFFGVDVEKLEGLVDLRASLKGRLKNPEIRILTKCHDFESKFVKFDDLESEIKITNYKMTVSSLKIFSSQGLLRLVNSVELADIKSKRITLKSARVHTSRINFSDITRFLGSKLDNLKFKISGYANMNFFENSLDIIFDKNFEIEEMVLSEDEKGKRVIISNDYIQGFDEFKTEIFYDGLVNLKFPIKFGNSFFDVESSIDEKEIDLSIKDSFVDFKEFNPIAGVALQGKGKIEGKISGPWENVVFDLSVNLKDFSLLDINFGNTSGGVKFFLKDNKIELDRVKGLYGQLAYDAHGKIFLAGKENLAIDFKIHEGQLRDLKKMIPDVVGDIENYLKFFQFGFQSNFSIGGGFQRKYLKIEGHANGENIFIAREGFDKFLISFLYESEKISAKNLRLEKSNGIFEGVFSYAIPSDEFSYKFAASNFDLDNIDFYKLFNFGYSGKIFGKFQGKNDRKGFFSEGELEILEGRISNKSVSNSVLKVKQNGFDIFVDAKFMGDNLEFNSHVDLDPKRKGKNSHVQGSVNIEDIKLLLGIISEHNTRDETLSGEVKLNFVSSFNFNNWRNLDLDVVLEKLLLNRKKIFFILGDLKKIVVKNGVIEDWNIKINEKGVNFETEGKGDLKNKFYINSKFNVDGSFVEILSGNLNNVLGVLEGHSQIVGENKENKYFLKIEGSKLSFGIKDIPKTFQDTDLKIAVDNNNIFLESFNSSYGGGKIHGSGKIDLKIPFPEVNAHFKTDRVRVSYLDRSSFILNSNVSLVGKNFPYFIKGEVDIVHGEIKNEFKDLTSNVAINTGHQRFLPSISLNTNVNSTESDLRLRILKPVLIENSISEIYLSGGGRIFGSLDRPYYNGTFELSGEGNKFYFRGHEFELSEGKVEFNDRQGQKASEIKFVGNSRINEYDISIEIDGSLDNLNVNTKALPELSQEDILGLLTLGFTPNASRELDERERESLATLSIGSLVMDQLGINKNLSENLGLRLQVTSELEQGNDLLGGTSEDSLTSTNKVRSSTRIQVRKKVNEKVDLSVSSRLGGTGQNRQEMALDVKIQEDLSLKGVYEILSTDDLDNKNVESFGIDFIKKFKF